METKNGKNQEPQISKLQKFEMRQIPRSAIAEAAYNPRIISEESRKKLRKKMREVGLIQPLVWNQQTGNLVSGHQRLRVLDEDAHGKEFLLDVAVVDLDEKTEKEMNVFLNNQAAMGEFDIDRLSELFHDGIDLNDMGFDQVDIDLMFGDDSRIIEEFGDSEKTNEAKNILDEIKKIRNENIERIKGSEFSVNFYFVAVFKTQEEKDEILELLGVPVWDTYFNGDLIRQALLESSKANAG